MSFFGDLFGTGGEASKAAAAKSAGLRAGQAYADPLYSQARGDITSGYGAAQDELRPLAAIGTSGAGAYADITGAAGQAGQDRARALFMTDPGYQFARDEALKATERTTGTGGYQGSGNVLTALQDRASGLASKQYGDYVSRLAPFLGYSLGAGGALASADIGQGTALAGSLTDQAKLGYGTEAGVGSATAGGILGDAQARSAGIQNAIKLGTTLLGYATGGPAGGALGSFFGSGGGNQVSNSDPYGLGRTDYSFGIG
jgi:hypothetical protein